MAKEYKILWVDDEHNDQEMIQFIIEAENEGLNLEGYASFEEAFEVLEKNPYTFDAILLDAMFFEKKNQVSGTEDEKGIGRAIAKINELKSKKVFPWFVLSGNENFTKNNNSILVANDTRCFDKKTPKDVIELFAEIKNAANQQSDTQIRHKYHRVFEVCTINYIGDNAINDLLAILKRENSENAFSDPKLYFNPLRKIMDDLFIACNKYGLMPDVFIKPSVALNESSKFLSGDIQKGYQPDFSIFPRVVSNNVWNILAVCQPAAHRAEIDSFIAQVNTPYLLLSVTYQLLDVLLWFKNYVDNNNNVVINKTRYKLVNTGIYTTGIISQDSEGNYYCNDVILTRKHFNENSYNLGDEIRIIKTSINTNNRTSHLYEKSAFQSEKI